jgi:gas vesicle protein
MISSSDHDLSEQRRSGGSQATPFLTGFSVGLFVGAAGYYLYATERGKKLREHVADEWKTAKVELAKGGVIHDANVSMRELFSEIIQKTFGGGRDVGRGSVKEAEEAPVKEVRKHRLIATGKSRARRVAKSAA